MKKDLVLLEREIHKKKEYVALATVSAKNYQKTNLDIVKYLTTNMNTPGVYVTLNKPYATMKRLFQQKGIDTKMIIFIDAITRTVGGKVSRTRECLFIGSPKNLSDVSMSMDQAVRALPKEKFVFFDSLNTLLIYNKVKTVAKFVHFLAGKMRVWKVKGIIISLRKKADKDLIDELSQFCDILIDFGGKK